MELNILELNVSIPETTLAEIIDEDKLKEYIESIGWELVEDKNGNSFYSYHLSGYERIILPNTKSENYNPSSIIGMAYSDALKSIYRVNEIPSMKVLSQLVVLNIGEKEFENES